MDPNANLEEQRRIVQEINAWLAQVSIDDANNIMPSACPADFVRLAELAQALDEWLKCGGALPQAWCGSAAVDRRGRREQ